MSDLVCNGDGNIAVMDIVGEVNSSPKVDEDNIFVGSNTFTEAVITDTLETEDGNTVVDVAALGNLYGRNRIINGDFRVWQSGETFTINGDDIYTADMVNSGAWSGEMVITKGVMDGGSIKATMSIPATDLSGGTENYFSWNKIESQNVFDLNGKYVTISFNIKTNFSGTLSFNLLTKGQAKSYVTDFTVSANVKTKIVKTILLEADTIATNDNSTGLYVQIGDDNEGEYVTGLLDSWQSGKYYLSNAAHNWTKIAGNSIEVSSLQLEEGTGASKFEFVDYTTQLNRCKRYYSKYTAKSDNDWGFQVQGVYNSTSQIMLMHPLNVSMRVAPTLRYSTATDFQVEPFDNIISAIGSNYAGSTDQVTFTATDSEAEGFKGAGATLIFDKANGWIELDARL